MITGDYNRSQFLVLLAREPLKDEATLIFPTQFDISFQFCYNGFLNSRGRPEQWRLVKFIIVAELNVVVVLI